MPRQWFDGLETQPPTLNLTAITGVTVETALWPAATWSPFPAGYPSSGQQWLLEAAGIATAPATTPGTLIITPRVGTSTAGITLGASTAVALATQTAVPWYMRVLLTVRTIGLPGANSAVVAHGMFTSPLLVAAGIGFGGTVATADLSVASGLFIGVTPSVVGQSFTPQQISWRSLN